MRRLADALAGLVPARLALAASRLAVGRPALAGLVRSAQNPAGRQAGTLARILARQASSGFGAEHGYARLASIRDFRAAVPIRDFEGLRPWADRQLETGEPALTSGRVVMYARSSGTTGAPKLVPVTEATIARWRRIQAAQATAAGRVGPLFAGRVLAVAGAADETRSPLGLPAGAVTGLIYRTMPAALRARYVLPPEIFDIPDADTRYAAIARLALQAEDLSALSAANPSTFLCLLDEMRRLLPTVVGEIADGRSAILERLAGAPAAAFRAALVPSPARARALGAVAADCAASGRNATYSALFPRLAGIVAWTGGSCALAAASLAATLPETARIVEAGYAASEGRFTLVVDADHALALPLLDDVFFEFVPVDAWDRGARERTLLLHELDEGAEYQVLLTTPDGLARYHINDVLRAGPRIGGTPTLAFTRKGRGVTNITGEKLTESQVTLAVAAVARRFGFAVPFHAARADETAARYRIAIEADPVGRVPCAESLAGALDAELARLNDEYAAKRASRRLGAPVAMRLRQGAGEACRRHLVAKGQRDAQLKFPVLATVRDCDFDLAAFEMTDAPPRD